MVAHDISSLMPVSVVNEISRKVAEFFVVVGADVASINPADFFPAPPDIPANYFKHVFYDYYNKILLENKAAVKYSAACAFRALRRFKPVLVVNKREKNFVEAFANATLVFTLNNPFNLGAIYENDPLYPIHQEKYSKCHAKSES